MAELPRQLPPDVAAALSRGNLIEAIKLLRGKYNIGLAEARLHAKAGPRIPPLAEGEWDPELNEMFESGVFVDESGRPLNVFLTLARHPKLFKAWLRFGGRLMAGEIGARERELVILRSAYNSGSAYEWAQHSRIGRATGLTDEEVARVAEGPDAPGWGEQDTLLLRATDELDRDGRIGDATWAALSQLWDGDERKLVELPMLAGHYRMLASVLATLGVEPEPGSEPLPG